VLELLQAAERGGFGFIRASATVRLVCAGWRAVHDALVKRLVLRRATTDEAMGMLVLRFPAVASVDRDEERPRRHVDVDGPGGARREQPPCPHVPRPEPVQADDGRGAAGSEPSVRSRFPNLYCIKVTAAGVQALRSTTAAPYSAHQVTALHSAVLTPSPHCAVHPCGGRGLCMRAHISAC
jgi:hypothetical protein